MAEPRIYTFQNGRQIGYRQVSHHTIEALRQAMPEPAPPTQTVEGPDGKAVTVPNPADPAHMEALREHARAFGQFMHRMMLLWGADFLLDEARQAEIAEFRAGMRAISDAIVLPEDDKELYLFHLCIGTSIEELDFFNAIRGLSQPTQEATAAAVGTF